MNLEDLKSITRDESLPNELKEMFWSVLAEFNQQQLRKYLKFVWGRTDLGSKLGVANHTIEFSNQENLDDLPTSSTCDFILHLDKYSSKEILKQKLLYAISNCDTIMDSDNFNALNID